MMNTYCRQLVHATSRNPAGITRRLFQCSRSTRQASSLLGAGSTVAKPKEVENEISSIANARNSAAWELLEHVPKPHRLLAARSWFFLKKSREALEKAHKLEADVLVLDMEDSVPIEQKDKTRDVYTKALNDGLLDGTKIYVRTNPAELWDEFHKDINMLASENVGGFMLPKVEGPEDVLAAANLLDVAEERRGLQRGSIALLPTVETPAAYFSLYPIVSSSPRVRAILAGNGDLSASVVCDSNSHACDVYFSSTVLAARAGGVRAIGGVHSRIDDHAGFENFCLQLKRCGFTGVIALTPKQVILANAIFSRTYNELQWAKNVLEAGENGAISCIQPSIQESREMTGPPHRIKAQAVLDQHSMLSAKSSQKKSSRSCDIKLIKRGMANGIQTGEPVATPFLVTVTESWKSLWDCAFVSTNSFANSLARCKRLGYVSLPIPFSLVATLCVGFAVSSFSYNARVNLGFRNVFQRHTVLAGDTLQAFFQVDGVREKKAKDGNLYCITDSRHWLVNQKNEIVFQLEKSTMFSSADCMVPKRLWNSNVSCNSENLLLDSSKLKEHLVNQPIEALNPPLPNAPLLPGQVIAHDSFKVHGESETRMLCNLFRIVNRHHHNKVRYSHTDILVPGPFVFAATVGNAALDLGEVIYEDIPYCANINKVNIEDQISTLTYVSDCSAVEGNENLELVSLKHLGFKNLDTETLLNESVPAELFSGEATKPSDYEKICISTGNLHLLHKVACVINRRIVRVKPAINLYK